MDCIVHGVAKSQTRLSDFHLALPETRSYFKMASLALALSVSVLDDVLLSETKWKTMIIKGHYSLMIS